jgi:hypothetical protein
MEGQQKWLIRLVSGVWAANMVAGMIPWLHYTPNESVNGVFGLIVGALFVTAKTPKALEEKPDSEKETP